MEKDKLLNYLIGKKLFFINLHGVGGSQKMRNNYMLWIKSKNILVFDFNFFSIINKPKTSIVFVFLWYQLFFYSLLKLIGVSIIYRPNSIQKRYLNYSKSFKHRIYVTLYNISLKYLTPNLIIAQSEEIKNEWLKYKTIKCYNFEITKQKKVINKKRIFLNNGLFVGRDVKIKQVDKTIKTLVKYNCKIDFFLNGIERFINCRNGNIYWNKSPNYKKYDFLIITSLYEGFPNVVLEACFNGIMVFGLNRLSVLKEINLNSIKLFDSIEEIFDFIDKTPHIDYNNEDFIKNFLIEI